MNGHFLAGILAGLASALLASPLLGGMASPVAVPIYFAPLPILIVSLCWRHQSGLIAMLVAALALLVPSQSLAVGIFMLLGIGLPAWGLAYLILLGRTTENGMEWYPLGHVLVWVVGIASTLTAIFLLVISQGSYERYLDYVQLLLNIVEPRLQEGLLNLYNREMFLELLRGTIPATQGTWTTLLLILNLWFASKLSFRSKRMPRPWPFIPNTRMPLAILGFAAAGTAIAFIDGFPGLIGAGMRAAAYTALFLQGLMFLHFATWGRPHRIQMLIIAYIAIPLTTMIGFGLLLYGLIGIGIADVLFDIRSKFRANGSPPK